MPSFAHTSDTTRAEHTRLVNTALTRAAHALHAANGWDEDDAARELGIPLARYRRLLAGTATWNITESLHLAYATPGGDPGTLFNQWMQAVA